MTELGDRMRPLADTGHERADELRAKADEFDAKTDAHYAETGGPETAKSMLGAWARARMLWADCSGGGLVSDRGAWIEVDSLR